MRRGATLQTKSGPACFQERAASPGYLASPPPREARSRYKERTHVREPSTYLRRPMPCKAGKRAFQATKRNQALRSPHTQPQCWKEPAGATLVAGSRRRGIRTDKARRGPARTAGHFRETGCRVGNPRSKPDPARRAIDKRPRTRPFLDGSPQAWPRGWHPPALAPKHSASTRCWLFAHIVGSYGCGCANTAGRDGGRVPLSGR
jgi:hypothetical protein